MEQQLHLQPHTHNVSAQTGAIKVEEGVYFVRGQFVRCNPQILYFSQTIETQLVVLDLK